MSKSKYKIAVIPGDGIGKEVMPEGVRVLDVVARQHDLELQWDWFDFASADYYLAHGKMMPDNWFELLKGYDAIYFGAVGWPDVVPDHVSLWASLLQFRREFDQYVNLRPCRLMPGVTRRWPTASRATSTSGWCGKTPRASIPASAGGCSPAPSARSCCRKR